MLCLALAIKLNFNEKLNFTNFRIIMFTIWFFMPQTKLFFLTDGI